MDSPPYAHSAPDGLPWEPLFTPFSSDPATQCQREACESCRTLAPQHGHSNKVAYWCAAFAAAMFPPGPDRDAAWQWGYLLGLLHDLGKFAPEWQAYLKSKADPHQADVSGKLDHSTAGAQYAVKLHAALGHLLAYPISGHHSGLQDATSNGTCLAARLKKTDLPRIPEIPSDIGSLGIPKLPSFLKGDAFSLSFFTRMLFSCLVDADFLATEAFMNPSQAGNRNRQPEGILEEIARLVDAKIDNFGTPSPDDTVAFQRRKVVEDCRAKASDDPGIFTLTVPTGGGKTLSSLSFALRHAIQHGQTRVIFVIPFTSIIEQNADVIREILAPLQTESFTPLIEHHSALSPDKEDTRSRLAAENWDAPVIITTAVQFYESLFAAKTSRTRKLHHIAKSVVVLDEAQTLPVDYLRPCLRVLQELSDHYHTTTVLCTATQPAIGHDETEFPIGLRSTREIISDTRSLFSALKRVEVAFSGPLTDAELVGRLRDQPQVLCIVNRRKHAQELFRLLGAGEGNYHLSALMCPEHRSEILRQVRERLEKKLPVRLISTQLIEAGVDVDFPVVYRSLAGLDSIAQAAGRCNRNGKLAMGSTYIFEAEDQRGEAYFRETAQVARELIELYPDLLGEDAIRRYFDKYYYHQKRRWDSKDILSKDNFHLPPDKTLPLKFQFKTVVESFKLIEDWQEPVIIPFDKKAESLIEELKNPFKPLNRDLLRSLQRYTVQISPDLRKANAHAFEALRDDQFQVLISKELNYSKDFGLCIDENYSSSRHLVY
ncbi:CRISPR-associated endonuclease Cas3'' [Luteolibacter flavescens]|uniref:CRISPR-associated endonuclease Cas3 n=1 Tax=Luteolibacter flavescens TaxID=1859460 RepID=A0ABT3FVJ7_9BACT|nr:CRISPR-associated endonuclease Cas3'' [Luteolibacter flavescens]MCW1887567.1 CRISPR-associated endonuclease Cas3'' [Luteolibacter flavescens]